jgi:tetratricopeptide (TPR) repeat protein
MTMRAFVLAVALVGILAVTAAAQALPSFNTSRLYRTEAEFAGAIQPYQRAVQADARNARAHYWLGVAYLEAHRQWMVGIAPYASGYLPRAITSLSEAIKLDPSMLVAYPILIDAHSLAGDEGKANEVADQLRARTRPQWLTPLP